jgi:hypothetical protein
MEKRYFLLKDYNTGEPREMLAFNGNVGKDDIQNVIWDANNYYFEHEEEILNDPNLLVYCQYDYDILRLREKFDFEILNWNWGYEDNLYF